MTRYVELCCQSAFSFLHGASDPEDVAQAAAELGVEAVALSDRDGLYAAPRFLRSAREAGIRPLVGADLLISAAGRVTLLVKNRQGYQNLGRLITAGHRGQAKGFCAITLEQLEEHAAGLLCLGGRLLDPCARPEPSRILLQRLRGIFPGADLWLELGRHFERQQAPRNQALLEMAEQFGVGLVACNQVAYARSSHRRILDVFTCIREKVGLDEAGDRLSKNAERHIKSPEQMAQLFSDRIDLVENTVRVAERCEFTLADLGYHFPGYPLPAGETAFSYLHRLVQEGARWRYRPLGPRHMEQLSRELSLIAKLQLSGYFLVVWDICRYCRERGILVQGRGSAANSAVCYVLGITAVDPVGMDLLFERFLSEERGQWPDIDLDLPSGQRREEIIQYVYRRYGPHGAAMTANVITYRARSAVREVGKVFGLPPERLGHLLDLESHRGLDLPAAAAASGLEPEDPRVKLFLDLCLQFLHLPRHLGQHSGGMVLAAGRLDEVVPLEPASMPGRTVVQWDKDDCADMGIIKVDLLGLGMMRVLEEAVPLVKNHEGVEIDLAHLPADDAKVYGMLQRADTVGVFQVESRAQMSTLPRLRPRCFYDLVVEVALIRPGPIVGKMVHPYLKRRNGEEEVSYGHPLLQPILSRTLGVPIFQEQIMRMAMEAAGFNLRQVEELRRAMKHRSGERLERQIQALFAGMAQKGISGRPAEEIVDWITSFLGVYGFPESHAASFALIVYASAYLKAHHPAAFTCALLNAWPMGFYHPASIVKDAQRHHLLVRPVEVSQSSWLCKVEPDLSVRLGLRFVLGLRQEAGERIEAEQQRAAFRDLADFHKRCRLRENELHALAELGAFAHMGLKRREALWQVSALGGPESGLLARLPPPSDKSPLPEMTAWEKTRFDFKNTGLTTGPHPLAHFRSNLLRRGVLPSASLKELKHGRSVRVAGLVITRQRPPTAKGMFFLTLEDESGQCNVVVTPQIFEKNRALLSTAGGLMVSGKLERQQGVIHLRGEQFLALPNAVPTPPSRDFH